MKNSPSVRLAHVDGAQGDCVLKGEKGVTQIPAEMAPPLLVSYYYLEPFLKNQHRYCYRDWVMDSGAFSAANSGKTIDLNKYIDCCLELLAKDKTLTEVFALDVIGNPEASLKNCEEMWRQGVPAIPCFHQQEPEEFLIQMAKDYPKIALGGVALERGGFKFSWLEQCFARVWPKKIHGFGMSNEEIVYGLPFHSVDATNWEIAPCAFGSWKKFGKMSVRGSNQDLRSQVKFYLDMEAKARVRWKKEMAQLEALGPSPMKQGVPSVRLAVIGSGREDGNITKAGCHTPEIAPQSAAPPSVKLAVGGGDHKGREITFAPPALAPEPPPKKAVKSVEAPPMDDKWVDYWKKRNIHGS